MSTIVLRSVKGTPLTNTEVDTNFSNLNTDKLEAATSATLTNKTINLTSNTLVATSAQLLAAITDETGTGSLVFATSPTLVTPVLGAATGTSFQGIIGNVTPAAGNFTTLGASSTATLNTLASSGATLTGGTINGMTVGATTASTGAFTTLSAGNGISFFNNLDSNIMLRVGVGITSTLGTGEGLEFSFTAPTAKILSYNRATSAYKNIFIDALTQTFGISGTTQLTLNSSSLYTASGINVGIGTNNPTVRLQVNQTTGTNGIRILSSNATTQNMLQFYHDDTKAVIETSYLGSGAFKDLILNSQGGNVGVGVSPSAWSGFTSLQVSSGFAAWSSGVANARMNANTYYNGGYKYIGSGTATMYEQDGYHAWYTAGSGTIGNPISFTQVMTLGNGGFLGIGPTNPAYKLDVRSAEQIGIYYKTSGAYGAIASDNTGTTGGGAFSAYVNGVQKAVFGTSGWIKGDTSTDAAVYADSGGGIQFFTNNSATAKAIITTTGNFGIGLTPTQKFEVYNASGDTLSYGSNPRLILTVPTGTNGFRIVSDTTPFEAVHPTNGSQFGIGADANVTINAVNATAGATTKNSPTIAFLSKYWNGSASVSQMQGFIGVTSTAATNTGGYFGFGIGSAEALRLNNAGNLGLGVTPSAWYSNVKAFQIGNGLSLWSSANTNAVLSQNLYLDETATYRWITANPATNFNQSNGAFTWQLAAGTPSAGGAIGSFSTYMTLDASGNLMVGTTTSNSAKLTISNAGAEVFQFYPGVASNENQTLNYNRSTAVYCTNSVYAADHRFFIGGNEKARISSSGFAHFLGTATSYFNTAGAWHSVETSTSDDTLVVFNNNASPFGVQCYFWGASPNNGTNYFYSALDTTATRFRVYSNGGIANYQANDSNLSDRREKTNFAPAGSYLNKICAIPVQTFNYIDQNMEEDGGLTLGVVAQDVQAVAPELVVESNWASKDAEPKMRLSIYQTDLQYALMKCIQEQQIIIESLKARLDAANL